MAEPIQRFIELLERAKATEPWDPTAAALATADVSGRPSVRVVLLKEVDSVGFVFFTNYTSRKSRELEANPRAALCFHWPTLGAQVRIEGGVERISPARSDAYFATRPRDSQLATWASRQSAPLGSREELLARHAEMRRRFADGPVPRPPFWGGYRVRAERIEFWQFEESRLHQRVCYHAGTRIWRAEALQP